jgi:hypothetical protein
VSHLGDLTCALIDAELDGHAYDQALSHLAGCPHCRRAVADQRWVKAHLAVAAAPAVPPDDLFARLLRIPAAEDADDAGCPPFSAAATFADVVPLADSPFRTDVATDADSRPRRRRSPLAGGALGRPARPLQRSASRDGRRPVPLRPARLAAARRVGARSVVAASFAASVVVGLGGTVSGSSAASAGRTVSPAAAASATTVALIGAAVPRPAARPSVSVVYRRP